MSKVSPLSQKSNQDAATPGGQARISCPPQTANGLDKLELSLWLHAGKSSLFERFAKLKEEVQGSFNSSAAISFLHNDFFTWNLKRSGTKLYPYVFQSGDITLMLSSRSHTAKIPNCKIEIGSVSCQENAFGIYRELIMWLRSYHFNIKNEIISRVDLASDFLNCDIATLEVDNKNKWITRAVKFSTYYENWDVSGIMLGKGNIAMRIYDKTLSLKQDATKAKFFFDRWGCHDETPVTRVEFQFRREVLKEFIIPVNTVSDLESNIDTIWNYATHDWTRQALENVDRINGHQDRAELSDFWKLVQEQSFHLPVKNRLKNRRYKEILHKNILALREQARGCLVSVAAAMGHDCEDFFGIITTCIDVVSSDMAEFMADQEVKFKSLFKTRLNECYVGF